MDIKCFVQGCEIPPYLCCYCLTKATTLCHNHISYHIQENPNLTHNYKLILKILTPNMKEEIDKSLHSKLDVLKNEMQSFNTFVSDIFSIVQKIAKDYYTKNRTTEKICKKILKEINSNDFASILLRKNQNDADQLRLEDIDNEVQRRLELTYTSSFDNLVNELIDECIKFRSSLNITVRKASHENSDKCIYVFQPDSKALVKFDINSLKKNIRYHTS